MDDTGLALRQDPNALIDFSPYDDSEVRLILQQGNAELQRRERVARAPEVLNDMLRSLRSEDSEQGDPWVQPATALNAYPSGWVVTHEGKTWRSTTPGNSHEPGVSGWREQVPEGEAPPEWVQPAGAHDAYMIGERVTYEGEVWFCTRDGNAYPPPTGWAMENPPAPEPDPGTGLALWEVGMTYAVGERVSYESAAYECRQAHTAQAGWEPPNLAALWLPVES